MNAVENARWYNYLKLLHCGFIKILLYLILFNVRNTNYISRFSGTVYTQQKPI